MPTGARLAGAAVEVAYALKKMLWQDRRFGYVEPAQQGWMRRFQPEHHRSWISRINTLDDRAETRLGASVLLEQDLFERELHICRGERLAVVPGGLGELEDIGFTVRRNLPTCGEVGDGPKIAIETDEAVEDRIGDRMNVSARADTRIEMARIGVDRYDGEVRVGERRLHQKYAAEPKREYQSERDRRSDMPRLLCHGTLPLASVPNDSRGGGR